MAAAASKQTAASSFRAGQKRLHFMQDSSVGFRKPKKSKCKGEMNGFRKPPLHFAFSPARSIRSRSLPPSPLLGLFCLAGRLRASFFTRTIGAVFPFFAMTSVSYSPRFRAPQWGSLAALALGSASSVRVRVSARSFSGWVAAFAFRSPAAAAAFAARCGAFVGVACAVRLVSGRSGVVFSVVSVPCVSFCSLPGRGFVSVGAALRFLRSVRARRAAWLRAARGGAL
jgi:hypothetical protein